MNNLNEPKDSPNPIQHSQVMKAAIHYTVGQISDDIGKDYGLVFSKPVIATFAEFINRQIEIYAVDLEAFSKHARRTTINCEDVKLLARRNPKLKEVINDFCTSLEGTGSGLPKKGRKRKLEAEAEKQEGQTEVIEIIDDAD